MKKVVIWMHGLGASSEDMKGLSQALPLGDAFSHVCLQAPTRPVTINQGFPMPAWYDIFSLQRGGREDEAGIKASREIIRAEIEACLRQGYQESDVFLSGFSQGAAMALYTALSHHKPLAGVIALSGYLPLFQSLSQAEFHDKLNLPIFMAHGKGDDVVPLDFGLASKQHLLSLGFNNLAPHLYPMGHEVCQKEVDDLADWLGRRVKTD